MAHKGKITGLGGVFVKCRDVDALVKWYREVLEFPFDGYGSNFLVDDNKGGYSVWGPFKQETEYFKPSQKEFMINLRVDDLDAFLKKLEAKGIELVGERESHDYGKFAWIVDPEGTKIELWEQVGEAP